LKSSSGEPEQLDLDSGLPVTPEDVTALRRLSLPPMTSAQYLAFLASLGHATYDELKARPLFKGEPFVLHAVTKD
jgi:hypothetical protein